MAEKLTKVQREILHTLQGVPGAHIRRRMLAADSLYVNGTRVKGVSLETFMFIRPWLKEEPKLDTYGNTVYIFKPGAEISDAWRTGEIERQRVEAQLKQEEDQRLKEQEESDRERRIREAFGAIERGEIVGELQFNGYRLGFEYGGKWYSLAEEG